MADDVDRGPLVLQITDRATLAEGDLLRRIDALASLPDAMRGRRVVLLRDPALPSRDLVTLGRTLRAATRAVGARLWVNDRLDVAMLVEADGVHLGRRSVAIDDARALLGGAITVSVACHDVAEVIAARDAGADACTLSPIFASPGKGSPLGVGALRAARSRLGPEPGPVLVALGGVDPGNAADALSAGAGGVASIRGDLLARRLPDHGR